MKISALNRKLRRAFGGRVTAALEDNCIVLRGELGRWDDVVRAGQMAATKYATCHVVNDIMFTGGKDAPMRVPALRDDALDGQTPDVLIIGGGISGVSIARELTRQKLDILVVDKECDLALGASGRNDGEVHPGIDLGRGSVKHKYIRRGNAMYDQVCKELNVPFSRVGQYVCFQHGWLRPAVWGYCMWRKYHDGIADTELISGRELLRREPNFNEKTRFAISNPDSGCVCPYGLTIAYAENAVQNGARIALNTAVLGMDVADGRITAVAAHIDAPEGCTVIDAGGRLLTPGCVEAHCHIGLDNQCMRWEGMDYNEIVDPLTPQLRAIDSINPQDEAFPNAIRGGVTTACTGPGSANVVGGTFTVLKLAGKRVDNMLLKEPAAMKCAFGENPKGCYGQGLKKSPMTRMAVAALLRELLFKTQRYRDDKLTGKNPPFDMKLEAMLPVINGEIPLKCHAHRADDILTAVRIAKEFGVKATLDHCTDGELIADELAKEGLPVFVGPTLGSKSKAELRHKSFTTPGTLYKAGLTVSIITDAPVIPLEKLPMCAGLAADAGLPMDEAWRAITINPARSLGIDSRVGSLEPGKDADFVLWTADPLTTIGGQAYMTVIDGRIVYQAE